MFYENNIVNTKNMEKNLNYSIIYIYFFQYTIYEPY